MHIPTRHLLLGLKTGSESLLLVVVQFGIFVNAGQICSATSRLLIHEAIAPAFLEKLAARAESIKLSNPLEEHCRLGPLISEGQHQKVLKYIEVQPCRWQTSRCYGVECQAYRLQCTAPLA